MADQKMRAARRAARAGRDSYTCDQVSERIRVLVVDDHRMVSQGLELGLGREDDLEVVATAATAAEAVRASCELEPDVALVDFHLPDGTGAEAAAQMLRDHPGMKVVFLSADDSDDAVLAAVEVGACGYLVKSEPMDRIATAVRRAAEGDILIPPATLVQLMANQRQRRRQAAERERLAAQFTPREREVLGLMSEGLDNKSIADELTIGVTTVRWYVQNLLEKLEAHSKLEAVAKAAELGLIDR